MSNIDYERSFKKLVEQIKAEHKWAEDLCQREIKDKNLSANISGILFAYGSIKEFAEKLENGELPEEKG